MSPFSLSTKGERLLFFVDSEEKNGNLLVEGHFFVLARDKEASLFSTITKNYSTTSTVVEYRDDDDDDEEKVSYSSSTFYRRKEESVPLRKRGDFLVSLVCRRRKGIISPFVDKEKGDTLLLLLLLLRDIQHQ